MRQRNDWPFIGVIALLLAVYVGVVASLRAEINKYERVWVVSHTIAAVGEQVSTIIELPDGTVAAVRGRYGVAGEPTLIHKSTLAEASR